MALIARLSIFTKHHLMWCVHTSEHLKVGEKQVADRKTHRKPSSGSSTREKFIAAMINILGNNDESSDKE